MILFLALFACSDVKDDHDHDHDHDHDVITRIELELTPAAGGEAIVAVWVDEDNNGNPVIDDLQLPSTGDFEMVVRLFSDLEDPAEELTGAVEDDGVSHQLFFTGDVEGPATDGAGALLSQEYADQDANGLPLGLDNDLSVLASGQGEMTITLRHMPPVGGESVKVAGLAELLSTDGFVALPGDNDIQVVFPTEVASD